MSAPQLFLGTNWKMNKTVEEARQYTSELLQHLAGIEGVELTQLFLVPPFTAIAAVKESSKGKFWVGAQNMHWEESGPYTGEISAPMLRELGVDLVELGHAERRQYFNECDSAINRKVHAALAYGIRPLVCIGESAEDQEYGVVRETVARQVKISLRGVSERLAANLIFAYEPLWSIGGTETAANPEYVHSMVECIRGTLEDLVDGFSQDIPIIYGGDVNIENAGELLQQTAIDGLFVGRAAWEAENFAQLIRVCIQASSRRRPVVEK